MLEILLTSSNGNFAITQFCITQVMLFWGCDWFVLSSHGVHYPAEPRIFQPGPGHLLNCYWYFGWTCPLCVLVCMAVCVGGGREKLCWCGMLCWGVAMFGSVCCCCLISQESWSIWDCRFSVCLLWAMAFSSLHLTRLDASSSLLWASSLTIWRSLWCCMLKFCIVQSVLILCLTSNSALISLILRLKENIGVGC